MFNVGDFVRVKEGIGSIPGLRFADDMRKYCGDIFEIYDTNIKHNPRLYCLKGCTNDFGHWIFHESWLEPIENDTLKIEEKEIEEFICLK